MSDDSLVSKKPHREFDWEIFVVRVLMSLAAACALMIFAAFVGAIISPTAHGLPVVITGAVTFAIGFVGMWVFDPLENW